MPLYYSFDENYITVSGHTFPHKERIKALGGRFFSPDKTWRLPYEQELLSKVDLLCNELGGGRQGGAAAVPTVAAVLINEAEIPAVQPTRSNQDLAPAGYTISQLMQRVSQCIQSEFSEPIWVIGEVQGLQIRAQTIFLDLAEGEGSKGQSQSTMTAKGVIWRSAWKNLESKLGGKIDESLSDGMQLRCLCQVGFYQGRGSLTLAIIDIDIQYLKGALALAREKLLGELRASGLDQANKRLKMPRIPLKIGLLSAEGSRALTDFLHQLEEGAYSGTVLFVACATQGERVVKSVTAGLDVLMREQCDLIVITRGGGSAADLRWFDSPEIAYKIAHCKIPIVAAIGHHEDYCVAEEICFQKQKTPTAAADFIITHFAQIRGFLDQSLEFFRYRLSKDLMARIDGLGRVSRNLQSLAASFLSRQEERLLRQSMALQHRALSRVAACEVGLGALEQKVKVRDPRPWMAQGWTRLYREHESILRAEQVKAGDVVMARLIDGKLRLRVEE